jgi:perosamine synthetase
MTRISWWRTSFDGNELCRIKEAMANENVSQGPVTAEFESRIAQELGVPYVVATTSGSTALLMALIAVGVGPGDEVIVPNRTWIASAHAPYLLGAKVVLVDVEAERPVMNVTEIESKITPRTRAIIPVHLNGRSVAMDEIIRIADSHHLYVIEDAAQALCSRNALGFLGTQSQAGCFSLSVAKLISTGQGGFVVTGDRAIYEKLCTIRTHGVRDVIHASYTEFGFNFKFTDILAAVGLAQLDRLAERVTKVRAVYTRYAEALEDLSFLKLIPVNLDAGELPIYVEVLCPEREKLMRFLASRGIQTRPFYPDLHQATYLDNSGSFPHSEIFGQEGVFLPCGPEQSLENVDEVLAQLRQFRKDL